MPAFMRRLYITLLSLVLLMNVAAWPAVALAEMFDHQHEQSRLVDPSGTSQDRDSAHVHHGCASHGGQHFQGQPNAAIAQIQDLRSEPRPAAVWVAYAQPDLNLPFRPPLAALSQS